MNLKKIFSPAAEQLVNYNYTDIAAGTGYMTFYGAVVSGGYILSNNTFYSNNVTTAGTAIGSSAFLQSIDKDFDVIFNKPQTIKGNAIIEIPVGVRSNDATGGTVGFYVVAHIRKWNGTTETEIASSTSPSWTTAIPASASYKYNYRTVRINVPVTHFKSGETLRVSIECWNNDNNLSNKIPLIAHDPMSRGTTDGETYTFGTEATILKAQIPFKIDI